MRSIYENPYKYAVECDIPFELAKIQCVKQRHYKKMMKKNKPYCPKCGSKRIYYVTASYEDGYGDYCECDYCGETYETGEVPNNEYFYKLSDDFDAVLYFSCSENKQQGWIEACGGDTIEQWHEFAREMITGNRHKNLSMHENETSITDGWTDCCGYDFGLDAYGEILKVQYCPVCGRRITRII